MTNKGLIVVAIVVLIIGVLAFYIYIQIQKKKNPAAMAATMGMPVGMMGMGRNYQDRLNKMRQKIHSYWNKL